MNTALWIAQYFLALTFLYSGVMKSTQTEAKLVSIGQTGVEGLPLPAIRLIGIAEIAGSIGILVPWHIWIAPVLTPVTALCFAVIMLLAAPIHYKRKELKSVGLNILLLATSLFVAWGRFTAL